MYTEEEMMMFELSMFIGTELEKNEKLPYEIINSAIRICADRRVIQEIMHEYQESKRMMEYCGSKGHRIVSTSYGTPETGVESGYCTRCGWSFHHIMY